MLNKKQVYTHLHDENLIPKARGQNEFDNAYRNVADYGRMQFWDDKYLQDTEPFEWYYPYQYFRQPILDNIPLDGLVMVAGCGSSYMIEDMAADGYEKLVGVDISRVAVGQMKVRCADLPHLSFELHDLTDTMIPDETYDGVVDKALFDSIICSDGGELHVTQYIAELERMTKDNGVFIIISHGKPEERLKFLEQYDLGEAGYTPWYVDVQAVLKPEEFEGEVVDANKAENLYFVYICAKQEEMCKKKRAAAKKKSKQTIRRVAAPKI